MKAERRLVVSGDEDGRLWGKECKGTELQLFKKK